MSRVIGEDGTAGRDEQAADWCLRLAEGVLSADEERTFETWVSDSHNRAAFERAGALWRGIDAAADKPEFIRFRSAALESFRRANSLRWARRVPARWRWPVGIAASLLIAAITAVWLMRTPTEAFETGIGERRVVLLDDGTQLSLDAATRVEARLARDRRELRLVQGRARFDVAQDVLRPFTVAAANKVIVAIGTSFSVELLRQQMHIVLYEGKVQVLDRTDAPLSAAKPSQTLVPGRELVASLDTPTAKVLPADLPRSSSWEVGQLNFVNEPLGSAVERMNRYSKEKVMLEGPGAGDFKVSGVFTAGDVAAFIEGVTTFSPVRAVRESGAIVLRRAAANENVRGHAVPNEP